MDAHQSQINRLIGLAKPFFSFRCSLRKDKMLRRIVNKSHLRLFSSVVDHGIKAKLNDIAFVQQNFDNDDFKNTLLSLYKKGEFQLEDIKNEYVASALFEKLYRNKEDEDALLLMKVLTHKKLHQQVIEAVKHLIKIGHPDAARELIEEQKTKGIFLNADKVETLFK